MNKALIVAGCALIIALIIGATSHVKASNNQKFFDINKCRDDVRKSWHDPHCGQFLFKDPKVHADKFLRVTKNKARRAYA